MDKINKCELCGEICNNGSSNGSSNGNKDILLICIKCKYDSCICCGDIIINQPYDKKRDTICINCKYDTDLMITYTEAVQTYKLSGYDLYRAQLANTMGALNGSMGTKFLRQEVNTLADTLTKNLDPSDKRRRTYELRNNEFAGIKLKLEERKKRKQVIIDNIRVLLLKYEYPYKLDDHVDKILLIQKLATNFVIPPFEAAMYVIDNIKKDIDLEIDMTNKREQLEVFLRSELSEEDYKIAQQNKDYIKIITNRDQYYNYSVCEVYNRIILDIATQKGINDRLKEVSEWVEANISVDQHTYALDIFNTYVQTGKFMYYGIQKQSLDTLKKAVKKKTDRLMVRSTREEEFLVGTVSFRTMDKYIDFKQKYMKKYNMTLDQIITDMTYYKRKIELDSYIAKKISDFQNEAYNCVYYEKYIKGENISLQQFKEKVYEYATRYYRIIEYVNAKYIDYTIYIQKLHSLCDKYANNYLITEKTLNDDIISDIESIIKQYNIPIISNEWLIWRSHNNIKQLNVLKLTNIQMIKTDHMIFEFADSDQIQLVLQDVCDSVSEYIKIRCKQLKLTYANLKNIGVIIAKNNQFNRTFNKAFKKAFKKTLKKEPKKQIMEKILCNICDSALTTICNHDIYGALCSGCYQNVPQS
jgi:hypothetical protein